MAVDAELEAAGFRKHHVDARTLNIVHPQDTRQLGPFCRLDVATPLEVPLQPGSMPGPPTGRCGTSDTPRCFGK